MPTATLIGFLVLLALVIVILYLFYLNKKSTRISKLLEFKSGIEQKTLPTPPKPKKKKP